MIFIPTAALCDLAANAHFHDAPGPVHIAHVEADDLPEAQAGAQGEGEDQEIAEVSSGGAKDQALLVGGEGSGG